MASRVASAVADSWRGPTFRGEKGPILVGLLPVLFLIAFFLVPVLRLMLLSVEGGTLAHFEKALRGELYLLVMFETFKVAALVTLITLLLAYPVAYFLATASPRWVLIGLIFLLLPFWTSILVRTYAWMILLGRNGVVNQVLLGLGLIDQPVALLYNTTGVLIGMVHVLLPYMVFPIYSAMLRVDRDLLLAAEGLGASDWAVFRRVFLPLTLPGVIAGSSLVFILSLGFFIEQQVRQFLEWGFAAALSMLLLAAAIPVFIALNRLDRSTVSS
jgi:ABC-type spermidine/putrescine transport system permease subunit I